jgi:hypothetical protein
MGNLKLAQKFLGHSTIKMTADIYTRTTAEAERDTAIAIERAGNLWRFGCQRLGERTQSVVALKMGIKERRISSSGEKTARHLFLLHSFRPHTYPVNVLPQSLCPPKCIKTLQCDTFGLSKNQSIADEKFSITHRFLYFDAFSGGHKNAPSQ